MANHLSTAVSELPEYIANSRNVSAASTSSSGSIYNADGSIITGYISNWKSLSVQDRKRVIDERKRLGTSLNQRLRNSSGGSDKKKFTKLQKMKKENEKYKQSVSKLKRKVKVLKVSSDKKDDKDESADEEVNDPGDQFGGKSRKKGKKNG